MEKDVKDVVSENAGREQQAMTYIAEVSEKRNLRGHHAAQQHVTKVSTWTMNINIAGSETS